MDTISGKSLHRRDERQIDELFVNALERHQELDSDEELEAALRRELIELTGSDQDLEIDAEDSKNLLGQPADQSAKSSPNQKPRLSV